MSGKFTFGKKMQQKSWSSSEIDKEWEEKKMVFVLLGLIIAMILMAVFIWWIRRSLR